jgi:hypothetical protein
MLERRKFRSDDFQEAIAPLFDGRSAIEREVIGHSAQGRPLHLFTWGRGPVRVLAWSQIHGDEPTGTMILADLLYVLADEKSDVAGHLRDTITIAMLPMLNPDGAERFVRTNAQHLDPNRDGRVWQTAEARALRDAFARFVPHFAIDLHDQDPRKLVGDSDRFIAYSVLAPRSSESANDDPVRTVSKQLCCVARDALERVFAGHVCRYPDTFEPRGLEEYVQQRGCSVVLLEAGGWRGDFEKQALRRGGLDAITALLTAIAQETFRSMDPADYEAIPENGKAAHDLLLRGLSVAGANGAAFEADVAIDFDAPLDRRGGKVTDMGDLQDEHALEEIDLHGSWLRHANGNTIENNVAADLEVLSGPDTEAALRLVIEDGRVLRNAEDS